MKYALIADIHANLEALEVVLEDAKKNNCTHYVCLGDVVGYNPNPKECMKIVRDMGMPCIMYAVLSSMRFLRAASSSPRSCFITSIQSAGVVRSPKIPSPQMRPA